MITPLALVSQVEKPFFGGVGPDPFEDGLRLHQVERHSPVLADLTGLGPKTVAPVEGAGRPAKLAGL
jgi:hypothetical protein